MLATDHIPEPIPETATGPAKSHGNDEIWARVRTRLRAELGEDIFASWFARLDLVSVDGDVAHLSVPTRFLRSWLQGHYIDRIEAVFAEEHA
jgi:chromosomal replication initiator protein